METAYKLGIRPLTFLTLEGQPDEPWTHADKQLLLAWTILQKETCTECGQPMWICRSDNKDISFSVRKSYCYAKAKMEQWKESPAGKKAKPADLPYLIANMPGDETLPTRVDYLKQIEDDA